MRQEARLKPFVKGIGSIALSNLRSTHQVAGTASAAHCYNLFMRHFDGIARHLGHEFPESLVEIGPGSSLGVGLTALLCGVQKYYALDLQDHRSPERDRLVLDAVAQLLKARAPFSDTTDLGAPFFPPSPDVKIWDSLGHRVDAAIGAQTVADIDREIATEAEKRIRFVAPWTDRNVLPPNSVDWIMTHSVMEHVDDLGTAYESMARWLKPGGYATHLIDFSAHTLTRRWNGHWKLSPTIWALMRGRRPYLINRMWRSHHINLMSKCGFDILSEVTYESSAGLDLAEMRPPFSGMPPGDERVAMSFIVARRV